MNVQARPRRTFDFEIGEKLVSQLFLPLVRRLELFEQVYSSLLNSIIRHDGRLVETRSNLSLHLSLLELTLKARHGTRKASRVFMKLVDSVPTKAIRDVI